jgi:hypothetical protein
MRPFQCDIDIACDRTPFEKSTIGAASMTGSLRAADSSEAPHYSILGAISGTLGRLLNFFWEGFEP